MVFLFVNRSRFALDGGEGDGRAIVIRARWSDVARRTIAFSPVADWRESRVVVVVVSNHLVSFTRPLEESVACEISRGGWGDECSPVEREENLEGFEEKERVWKRVHARRIFSSLSFFSSERNGGRWWGMRRSEEKNCRPCVSFRGVRQGVHVYIRIHTYARAHTLRTHVYSRVKKVVLSLCDLSGSYFVCTIA